VKVELSMAYFSRTFVGLSKNATITPLLNTIRYTSSLNAPRMLLQRCIRANYNNTTRLTNISRITGIRHLHTEGDRELSEFLKEEISQEMELKKKVPKIANFSMRMDGTIVTLNKTQDHETVVVSFDVNKSLIMPAFNEEDEAASYEEQGQEEEEEEGASDLISFPQFTVTITKTPSGKALLFNCSCKTGSDDDDVDIDEDDDEEEEMLSIDSVQAYDAQEMDVEKVYEAETDHMDGHLYELLHNTLVERGITEEFVTQLIALSTAVEHGHYIAFLKNLNKFAKD